MGGLLPGPLGVPRACKIEQPRPKQDLNPFNKRPTRGRQARSVGIYIGTTKIALEYPLERRASNNMRAREFQAAGGPGGWAAGRAQQKAAKREAGTRDKPNIF
jgi:hypothetical protein